MAGLLNAKQLVDGSVTPNKLSERYLQVNEQGEVYGDLIVNGDTTLTETATYKGSEIATHGDLYAEGGITDLINELDEKKQDNLIAGENIDIASDGVTISSSTKVAGSDRVLTYDATGLKANISLVVDGNHIRVEGKTDESGDPYILGEFNVLQSQIIDNVYIENGHLFITFIVDGDPGKEKVDIDLSEFIDIYEGSDYININGQQVSLKYSEVRDQLINDGMALTGQIPKDYVDLSNAQTIGGVKTFNATPVFNTGSITIKTASLTGGNLTASNTGLMSNVSFTAPSFTGSLNGNASTATTLQNARLFWGRSFNGSGDVYGTIEKTGSVIPDANNTYHIGTSATRYANGYFGGTLEANALTVGGVSVTPSNYVTLSGSQTISGVKTFSSVLYSGNAYYGYGRTATNDGKPGVIMGQTTLYIGGASPKIEFQYNGSTATTSTIQETSSGKLHISATNGISLPSIYGGSTIYSNNKTSITDGKDGIVLTSDAIHICRSAGNSLAYLTFRPNGATSNNCYITGSSTGVIDLRGSATRPTYNGGNLALYSDIPDTSNFITTTTANNTYVALTGNQNVAGIKNFTSRPTVNTEQVALLSDVQKSTYSVVDITDMFSIMSDTTRLDYTEYTVPSAYNSLLAKIFDGSAKCIIGRRTTSVYTFNYNFSWYIHSNTAILCSPCYSTTGTASSANILQITNKGNGYIVSGLYNFYDFKR